VLTRAQWLAHAAVHCQSVVNGTVVMTPTPSIVLASSMLTTCAPGTEALCHFSQGIATEYPLCASVLRATVTISMDGQLFTTTAAPYAFHAHPTITAIQPRSGSAAGGTAVTIIGQGFYPGVDLVDGARCRFGATATSPARLLSVTQAACAVAPLGAAKGGIQVFVAQNGLEWEPLGMAFSVFRPLPTANALVPAVAQVEGGYQPNPNPNPNWMAGRGGLSGLFARDRGGSDPVREQVWDPDVPEQP
jgi:hypothetical protein